MTGLILAAIAWGALSFGAVYPWGYWPLFAGLIIIGTLGWRTGGASGSAPVSTAGWAFGALAFCAAIQLVPLPSAVLSVLSPATDTLLRQYDIGYATGVIDAHPLSIVPRDTRLALFACIALGVFAAGTARWLSRRGVSAIADGLLMLGALLAIIAIVQKASLTTRIYGFWTPLQSAHHIFGPFVNRNHFAGWMLMTSAVSIGVFCARLASAMRDVRPDWRSRALWLSTPEANQLLLRATAIAIMGISIALTLSRSGIVSFSAALLAIGAAIVFRGAHRSRRGTVALGLVLGTALLVAWSAGVGRIVDRFSAQPPLAGRMDAWRIAARMAGQFPLTGTGINTFDAAVTFFEPPGKVHWNAAHNDYLQLAVEGGLLVAVPFLCAVALSVRLARDRIRAGEDDEATFWIRVGALAGIGGIALQESVDFSLQLPGIAALFALLCAIALHAPCPVDARRRRPAGFAAGPRVHAQGFRR